MPKPNDSRELDPIPLKDPAPLATTRRTPRAVSAGPRAAPPARTLGYAGPRPRRSPSRMTAIEREQAEQNLWDWLTPVLMIGISALVMMFGSMLYAGQFDLFTAAGVGIVVLVIAVIKTVVALVMAMGIAILFGSGFDSFWRETLRLGGIVMTASAVLSLVEPWIGCFAIFVYGGLIVTMLMTMMDLDQGEAVAFAVAFIIAEIATYIFLAQLIESLLA